MMVQGTMMGTSGTSELKLIDRMKEATQAIHKVVENRQFIQDLMKGEATPEAYMQYLVDLQYIYIYLEAELVLNDRNPKIAPIVIPELFRSVKINKDIVHFHKLIGAGALQSKEVDSFRSTIDNCTGSKLHCLAAFVYLRMLGDLFGGRDIGAAVKAKWGEDAAAFYDYSELMEKYNIESLMRFAAMTYRPRFNQLELTVQEEEELIKETVKAFELTDALLLSYERI